MKKHFVNDNVFAKQTPERDYWLGILMADGCITLPNIVRLTLKNSDSYHLLNFYSFVGSTTRELYANGSCSQAHVYSEIIAKQLNDFGIIPHKSHIDTSIHSSIALSPYFWLGVLDGDGCITRSRAGKGQPLVPEVSVCGCLSVMSQLSHFIEVSIARKAKPRIHSYKHSNLWVVSVRGQSAKLLLNKLYQFDIPSLQRKADLAQKALAWQPNPRGVAKRQKTETKPCDFCGNPVTRRITDFSKIGTFCTPSCWHEWRRQQLALGKGQRKPKTEKTETKPCNFCGNLVTRRVKISKLGTFCTPSCWHEWRRQQLALGVYRK
jgi:hypothetical protein